MIIFKKKKGFEILKSSNPFFFIKFFRTIRLNLIKIDFDQNELNLFNK